jgi:hypothetical protein
MRCRGRVKPLEAPESVIGGPLKKRPTEGGTDRDVFLAPGPRKGCCLDVGMLERLSKPAARWLRRR